jgi:hypothetical protein
MQQTVEGGVEEALWRCWPAEDYHMTVVRKPGGTSSGVD